MAPGRQGARPGSLATESTGMSLKLDSSFHSPRSKPAELVWARHGVDLTAKSTRRTHTGEALDSSVGHQGHCCSHSWG